MPSSAMKKAGIFRQVAGLHVQCIDQGFLATLGVDFLTLMYEAIESGRDSVLLVSETDGRVAGFVAGASAMRPIYRHMLSHWPRLALALLPCLWSPRRAWRILEILRHSARRETIGEIPDAELLAIAVDPMLRRTGLAANLYQELSAHFRSRGMSGFQIIVGAALTPAHRFYKKMGAVPITEIEVHGGSRSVVYVQDLTERF